ncbi:MAG: thioredoxin family protein [Planctomycetota bacterium]|nr:MAG: thioredoxin family protein [Planctomycetota bacterium]
MKYLLALPLMMIMALSHAAVSSGDEAPTFALPTATGESVDLADLRGNIVILEWVNYDCPFVAKHYRPGNMQALQTLAKENDMVWLSICSSAPGTQGHWSGDELLERIAAEESQANHYLIDEDGTVGRAYGARTTPHMFIINAEGTLVYTGGIDSIRSVSSDDIEEATPYVREAIEALIAGEDIPNTDTEAYGCSVKYADE